MPGFFDLHPQYATRGKTEVKIEVEMPPGFNNLAGECTECGSISDNVMFGYCMECHEAYESGGWNLGPDGWEP